MKKRLDPDYSLTRTIGPHMLLDRKGEPVTKESHMAKYPGRAYGFFDCNVPIKKIISELPKIKRLSQVPSNLELSLTEGLGEELERDPMLMAAYEQAKSQIMFPGKLNITDRDKIIKQLGDAELRYAIKATYPGHTNEDAAKGLAAILNTARYSPIFGAEDPFRGAIAYKQAGEYIFHE